MPLEQTVVDALPPGQRSLFTDIVGETDPALLSSLQSRQDPTGPQRLAVEEILSTEFSRWLNPDGTPSERAIQIDDLLGAFLLRWPTGN